MKIWAKDEQERTDITDLFCDTGAVKQAVPVDVKKICEGL
jgi:hypothetical protein